MNSADKKLVKHKAKLEQQSRRIGKIGIGKEKISDSDKIKESILRYFKYQFRCGCKNKKRPKRCKIYKTNQVKYAKVAAKNFKRVTYKQKRINNALKNKMDQKITKHELDEYVTKNLNTKLKSPGPDGIPYEFITGLWNEIRTIIFYF